MTLSRFHYSVFTKRAWYKTVVFPLLRFRSFSYPLFTHFHGIKSVVVVVVAFSNDSAFGAFVENDTRNAVLKSLNFEQRFQSLLNGVPYVPYVPSCLRCWRAFVPSCPNFRRALVPSMLACPRARVPKFLACPRAFDAGVPSRLNFRRALVPSMLMFRTLLRDVTLEMFLESLKLSDPFFLNFIRET